MIRGIATVFSGAMIAQIIGVVVLPVLSRLYTPEAFGLYQIYASLLAVLLMAVGLRYEVGLLTTAKGGAFERLVRLVFWSIPVGAAVIALGLAISHSVIERYFADVATVVGILAATLVISGFHHALTYLPIRNRDYRLVALSKITQALVYAIIGIAAAFVPLVAFGLIIADVCGRLAASMVIARSSGESLAALWQRPSIAEIRRTALHNRQLPLFTFPGTLMSSLAAASLPIAFFALVDVAAAGQYALINRFVLLPVAVVAGSVGQVFTGDFAARARGNTGGLGRRFRRSIGWLFAIAVVPAIAGYFLAPWLIPTLFGPQWQLAGEICAVAMPIALISFIAAPVSMTLILCNRIPLQLAWESIRFLATVGMLVLLYRFGVSDPIQLMTWYAAVIVLSYVVYLVLADRATSSVDQAAASQRTT